MCRLDYFLHIRSGRPPLLIPVANNIECGCLKRAYNYIIIIIIGLLITEKIILLKKKKRKKDWKHPTEMSGGQPFYFY